MFLQWQKRMKSQEQRYPGRYKVNRRYHHLILRTLLRHPAKGGRVHRCPLQRYASVFRGGCAEPGFESPWGRHRSVESTVRRQSGHFAHTFAPRCGKVHGCPKRDDGCPTPATHSSPASPTSVCYCRSRATPPTPTPQSLRRRSTVIYTPA